MRSGSEPRMPDKPLETDHPETTHLTPTCSCEACSAFTRVAARTLARSPIRDQLHRRLQPFCYLHDCSGCFRLERLPGGACTHWKAPPWHGAHVKQTLRIARVDVAMGGKRASRSRLGKARSPRNSRHSIGSAKKASPPGVGIDRVAEASGGMQRLRAASCIT